MNEQGSIWVVVESEKQKLEKRAESELFKVLKNSMTRSLKVVGREITVIGLEMVQWQ